MENDNVIVVESSLKRENREEKLYSIKEISSLLNVHEQTLRNWERKNLVVPLRVGLRRIYTDEHLKLCKKIKQFSGKGISLNGIKEMLKTIENKRR
ncbi:MAG: MerR family transcriptional regulator [Candidatus Goldbacteria bacterium]|nr:MerR family transcriptional regulator [Candidatus Goldiibacteriota bacterium]HPD18305.1 helix-turn-helix domain-containing protein [Candidatus Goldiibacteriota bacterium]